MFCTVCGAKLEDDAAFCTSCGNPIATPSIAQVPPANANARSGAAPGGGFAPPSNASAPVAYQAGAPAAADPAAKRTKRIALIGGIAAVAVIAIVAVAVLFSQGVFGGGSVTVSPGGDAAGDATAATEQKQPLDVFVSQVDNAAYPQVTLYARIADSSGAMVDSLDAAQFTLTEVDASGAEFAGTIDELVPLALGDAMNINLVLDQSGSMGSSSKMANAKQAANAFIDEIVKTEGNATEITSFDDYVYNRQPFTADATLLTSAVNSLSPDGETALYDALYWALQRTNLKSGSRVVIAFTDGAENASRYNQGDVVELSKQTGIPVYLVGVGDSVDRSSLSSLATSCNGQYYDASATDLAQALQQIYRSIYDDQRSLYRVVYTSTCTSSETEYRTIRLACADGSAYQGTTERTYLPVDSVSSYDNSGNTADYVLPDSSSRYYSRSELEKLSLWELYLARNEIFARYGRGFKNQDLVDYFATRHWYQQRYTPEQFDAMGTPLNDYEQKNTQLMLEIERDRNSPYLVTAK